MKQYYSLNKSRHILHSTYKILKSKKLHHSPESKKKLQELLEQLEKAIFQHNQEMASELAAQALTFCKCYPTSLASKTYELTKAILFAGLVAFLVRQFWFELYEVPTGSMRPTILEQDRILVSKTTFGLHYPFGKKPLAFNPESVTRGGLVVFTVGDLPIPDADTKYFGFIPGKKRYIKRCMGRPGDILYFYGGKIYGLDYAGKRIDFPFVHGLENLYHVPYISFDGTTSINASEQTTTIDFKQMNQSCGRLTFPQTSTYGEFFYNKEWHRDEPNKLKEPHIFPVSYADLFGMGNYAMVRILTEQQARTIHLIPNPSSPTKLYLEISHTGNLSYPQPLLRQYDHQLIPSIQPMKTLLPLRKEHLHLIRKNLTTSRFIISEGLAYKYHQFKVNTSGIAKAYAIPLPKVPDGCYEYSKGEAYKISFGGIRYKLKPAHPLTQLNDKQVVDLFNCGINFSSIYNPVNPKQAPLPNRYAFFNQGNLYIMDSPVFIKNDPALQKFITSEKEKQETSLETKPYIAFIEKGLPPENFEEFKEFMQNFGIQVPQGHVLVLGDNYPMSADSREFGFVPVENLLGSPLCTFWPIGRIGRLAGVSAPTTLSGYLVSGIALATAISLMGYIYYQKRRKLFPDTDKKNPKK
ncbi:Signal peptidase I,signal peptidase I,signal peptidase I,Peptidase S24-like [Chlamydia serpentis]|uniref:Signal peptidase I n=1 Tax=Chlamydia serpentis TaxID=1967782 RepID=A0A2R8FAE8_9CHLA|nr:signal peptidase I [Chlamydia serpentis]SPN73276.1 Signal peptidase I,signal peptidase I,signal peptidase I,Peptidase S24-like [Chlamydia serpentis]